MSSTNFIGEAKAMQSGLFPRFPQSENEESPLRRALADAQQKRNDKMRPQMRATAFQVAENGIGFRDPTFGRNKLVSIHRWVPWVAGFSAEFVNDCLRSYLPQDSAEFHCVLDPFAGVGTTLVESFLQGCDVIGFEINPYAALASRVKLQAPEISIQRLSDRISEFERFMKRAPANGRSLTLPLAKPPQGFRGRTQLFHPKIEKKVLFALDFIDGIRDQNVKDVFRLALGSVMVSFSNYSYEPSLTRRVAVGKPEIPDTTDVGEIVVNKLEHMLEDMLWLRDHILSLRRKPNARLVPDSIFSAPTRLGKEGSVDLIVTSPPYLNNYHYPRNTRPQIHWLSLASGNGYSGAREGESFGKFWQTVRDKEPVFLDFRLKELETIVKRIRGQNVERGPYGGPGWANYAATYFNDTYRFCSLAKKLLRSRGAAIIVLGNSVIQGVEIKTDQFFGKIAELCGLTFEDTLVLRKKRTGSSIIKSSVRVEAAAEKVDLYESAVVLRR